MYKLGINFDEISDSLETSIAVFNQMQVKYGEIRTLNKTNFVFWDKEALETVRGKTEAEHIHLIAAASPLFKWYNNTDDPEVIHDNFGFNPRLDIKAKRTAINAAIQNANLLGIKKIRIFSELGKYDDENSGFYANDLLKYALSIAEQYETDLLLENEPVCKAHNKKQIIDIFENLAHPHLKLWLDIANLYQLHESVDHEFLEKIIHKIEYIHVKDFIEKDGELIYVPVGNGEIPYVEIFKDIYALKQKDIVVTIETHAQSNKKEQSIQSIIGMRNVLDKAGVQYE